MLRDSISRDGATAWKDFGSHVAFIEKTPDRYWGFAYLRPRTEKKVAEKLAGLNYPVYLPLVNKARLHHGTKVVTALPMIPSYIFLTAGDKERTELKKTVKEFVHIELLREPHDAAPKKPQLFMLTTLLIQTHLYLPVLMLYLRINC